MEMVFTDSPLVPNSCLRLPDDDDYFTEICRSLFNDEESLDLVSLDVVSDSVLVEDKEAPDNAITSNACVDFFSPGAAFIPASVDDERALDEIVTNIAWVRLTERELDADPTNESMCREKASAEAVLADYSSQADSLHPSSRACLRIYDDVSETVGMLTWKSPMLTALLTDIPSSILLNQS